MSRDIFLLFIVSLAITVVASSPYPENSKHDYIVIGGGTSGLAVANRLSENLNTSVLVIEAGGSVLNNENVTDIQSYKSAFGTDIAWHYESVPQKYGGQLRQVIHAGKALAGTSAVNGMAYSRVEDVQIDAWQALGNKDWTWKNLFRYYLKSENLTIPSQQQHAAGASYDQTFHGQDGPLHVGWKPVPVGNLTTYLNKTYQGLGIPWKSDNNGGKMRGMAIMPATIDVAKQVREDAARAYYWPYSESRPNLHVMLNTFVNRVVWNDNKSGDDNGTARGVEVTLSNGSVGTLFANKEVIVSAGSIRSPGILERSGIGNPAILNKHNIPIQVDLPTVGENLQDQTNSNMAASGYDNITGASTVAYPNLHDILGVSNDAFETMANSQQAKLKKYAADAAIASGGSTKESNLQRLFQSQYDLIFKDRVPVAEVLLSPGGGKALSAEFWPLLPFARGSVHVASTNPQEKPVINPNYFMFDWDKQLHIAIAKYVRRIFESSPMRDLLHGETSPGFHAVAENASSEDWEKWIFDNHYRANYHVVGTAAMLPQSLGGVVNDRLTVYGTTNVRVVDASIFPFQVCGHLSSTLYAIAEMAADFIKNGTGF